MIKNDKKRILIVDDAKELLKLLTLLLEAHEYSVECAINGRDALEILKKSIKLPDLIILDTQMPIMNGFEFRLHQSKNPRIKKIPVLVSTGDTSSNLAKKMRFPFKIEHKPFQVTALLQSITQCLTKEVVK